MRSYKYTGRTPVNTGDSVNVLDEDGDVLYVAKVRDTLAIQFTAYKGKRGRFLFYADKGLTWSPVK